MNKIVLYLLPLLLVAGCATTREPEQTITDTTPRAARHVERQKPIVTQPAEPVFPQTMQQAETEPVSRPAERPVVARVAEPTHRDLSAPAQKLGEPVTDGHKGWARLAEANENKLLNIYKGMDKYTVETIMASDHNPYKREKITGTKGQAYEVLFYLTREPRKNKPITDRQLTPVIFKNGELVAMGNFQLKKLRNSGTLGREKRTSSSSR
jgi:hypothetical protein